MFKFTRTGVNLISFFISLFIFILIQIFINQYINRIKMNVELGQEIMQKQENVISEQEKIQETPVKIWQIEIEKISLKANIAEGTTQEILEQYVGHFSETPNELGNVGLAAHNRGYPVNYFERLKEIQEGDKIIYRHNDFEKIYEVTKNKIIEDTDWEPLENTEENMLTLITCVENEPSYRRCVQAVELEENQS